MPSWLSVGVPTNYSFNVDKRAPKAKQTAPTAQQIRNKENANAALRNEWGGGDPSEPTMRRSNAAAAAALASAGALAGQLGKTSAVARGVAGEGQRAAGRLAVQRAQRQVLKKVAQKGARQATKKTGIEAAKKEYVKKLLNRAARGNHTLTTNMINKAVQRAGGDPRVAKALEKGGKVALNLLRNLA
jgi:hypothetical protein